MAQAAKVLVVAADAAWIWNLTGHCFAQAHQHLDYYHANQHLLAVAHALHPKEEAGAQAWVERRLHRLRHNQEEAVLREIASPPRRRDEAGKVIRREQN